ncbi:MAG: hypothetical protein DRQ42_07095 [Gammaproteobacteria bacterium]|nr:MAG: hypothetical protein DRQ42_07095 [Gammaproteobacteria bacterium]
MNSRDLVLLASAWRNTNNVVVMDVSICVDVVGGGHYDLTITNTSSTFSPWLLNYQQGMVSDFIEFSTIEDLVALLHHLRNNRVKIYLDGSGSLISEEIE